MLQVTTTVRSDNPNTIAARLAEKIGREPTNAELIAEVKRILREAREERSWK
jgi:hypothetical protein